MWNRIAETIWLFQNFILTTAVCGVLIAAGTSFASRREGWRKWQIQLYGWFLNRSDREVLFWSASLLQFLFVLSGVVGGTVIELPHLFLLLILVLVKTVSVLRPLYLIRDGINSILICMALMVCNILAGYLKETRFNSYVVVVLVLLDLFLVLYQGYFLFHDISQTGGSRNRWGAGKRSRGF